MCIFYNRKRKLKTNTEVSSHGFVLGSSGSGKVFMCIKPIVNLTNKELNVLTDSESKNDSTSTHLAFKDTESVIKFAKKEI